MNGLVTALVAAALLVLPCLLGAGGGAVLRRVLGRRLGGVPAALAMLLVPASLIFALGVRFPVVGVWDAAFEGLLVGVGVLLAAHTAFGDRRRIALSAFALGIGLIGCEGVCLVALPSPPGFPSQDGVHLWLADAMHAEGSLVHWDTLSKDIVCHTLYPEYHRIYSDRSDNGIITPSTDSPQTAARRHVLHIGDSMTYGFGVARNQTFVADLEALDPGVEHVNAGVPGIAPDAYYLLIRRWIDKRPWDLVVMYVYEENDLDGLDSNFPCSNWQPLLVYRGAGVLPRADKATQIDVARAGWSWVRMHSPPPYLIRALVEWSSAAAYAAAIFAEEPYMLAMQSTRTRLAHLEAILGTTRDLLRSRGTPLLVVVLPGRRWVRSEPGATHPAPEIVTIAQRLGIAVLDPGDALRAASRKGQELYLPHNDIHYQPVAHALVAQWLQQRYAQAVGWAPPPAPCGATAPGG